MLNIQDDSSLGGGQVNRNKAMDPGLLYDIRSQEYIQFLCSKSYSSGSISRVTKTTPSCVKEKNPGLNLNLPSISIPTSSEKAPYGIKVRVEPQLLSFNSTAQVLSYNVTLVSAQKVNGDYKFGSLTCTDGKHFVRSPIAVQTVKFESYADV